MNLEKQHHLGYLTVHGTAAEVKWQGNSNSLLIANNVLTVLYESQKIHLTSATLMNPVLLLSMSQCSPLHVLVFVSSASGPSRYCVPRNLSVFALSFFPHAQSVTAHCCSWFAPIWIKFYSTFSVFLVLLQHFSICWSFIWFFWVQLNGTQTQTQIWSFSSLDGRNLIKPYHE